MRNLLAFLGLLILVFLGVGYHRHWYSIATRAGVQPGHRQYEIDVDSQRIGDDLRQGVKAGGEKLGGLFKPEPPRGPSATPVPPPAPAPRPFQP